jgi:DNA invertase Pin-like site-specific DNA recombinase
MSKDHQGKRVAIYARVSTRKQADNELSITDQVDWAERWIAEHGARKTATFIDAGASATKDEPNFRP